MEIDLKSGPVPRHTPGASVIRTENGWHLEIPARSAKHEYCLAQLDDYASLPRGSFFHSPPWRLNLRARVSQADLPGTWGFGLWNDPFGFSLGFGGSAGRLPTLPNALWFFNASPPNWLSLQDTIPAHGFFAGSIHSPRHSSMFLIPALFALPLLGIRPISRWLRRGAGHLIRQEASLVSAGVTDWHRYSIEWLHESCEFLVDDRSILKTSFSPPTPLGLVIWIDNQYAAWEPSGRLAYGTLANPASWLEVSDIKTW